MTARAPLRALPLLILLTAGCTQFPELDALQTPEIDAAEYPLLVPIEPILAAVHPHNTAPDAAALGEQARLARLRARANRLRAAGLTTEEEERLRQGLR